MSKPIIGLTPSHDMEQEGIRMGDSYLQAIREAGGIPVVLPLEQEPEDLTCLADLFDGFVFTGGPDVHPLLFGEETHPHCGSVSIKRDRMELSLLPLIIRRKKPVLGICRGIQLLNIALGGTIWQDIKSQVKTSPPIAHSQPYDYALPSHTVAVEKGSRLEKICNTQRLSVNSMHHQGVKDTAPGLSITAVSPDGLAEALEMPDYPFFLGVQWHPERLWQRDEASARLFLSFVNACEYRKTP